MGNKTIDYRPPGPVSREFLRSDDFFRGIMGPYGSGKSTVCVMDILRHAKLQKPGTDGKRWSRWAIVRNTYRELATTTIKTWHQWVPPTLGRWQAEGPPTHHIQQGDIDLEVIFVSLDSPDDIRKLLGMELTGAWVDEAREIPKAAIDGLTGRVGRFPSAAMGGCSWRGIIASTNPPDTDHWWYKFAEEQTPDGWRFFRQPSGLSDAAENLDWLNQTDETIKLPLGHPDRIAMGRAYYEVMSAGKGEDWAKVYIHGEYGFVRDGKPVYPEYHDPLHCHEVEAVKGWPIFVGIDFGLTPAAAIAQRSPMGEWIVIDELVSTDMGARRFGELLHAKLDGEYRGYDIGAITGDPAGDSRAQTDETTPFQILRAVGVAASPAPSNDFTLRREAVAAACSRLIDGKPGFRIHPRCKVLRKAMGGAYCYKRLAVTGAERFRDVPDKNEFSHVAEALQYCMLGSGEGKSLVRRKPVGVRKSMAITDYNIFGD